MAVTSTEVEDLGKSPKRMTTDEGTVEEKEVKELIEADRYASQKTATTPPFGIRVARFKPMGTVQ